MRDVSAVAESLSREIPDLLTEHGVPGLAIGVCDAEGVLWSAGFGTTRAGGDQAVRTSTIFSVQSTSKMYTATAVMLGVRQGLVDLDEPITTYLPEFTVNSRYEADPERRITLRHLLSHTAGFTHEAPVGSNYLVGSRSFTAHCRSISDTWLRFPVGHHFEYSNLGIDLAGAILARTSGVPFHAYVRRALLGPLGVDRTTFDHEVIARDRDRAIGHARRARRLPVRIPMVAAGGLYTSIDDALRYVGFHLRGGEDLLDDALLEQMYAIPFGAPGQQLGYGLGVISQRTPGGTLVRQHGGGGFGFLCYLGWAPDHGLGVVVLTNAVDHSLENTLPVRVLDALVEAGTGQPAAPPLPPPTALPPEGLDRLAGQYVGRGWRPVTIAREGAALWWVEDGDKKRLRVVGPHEVVREDASRARFRFLPDAAGRMAYLQSVDDGFTRYRNDPPDARPPTGPALDPRWEGEYTTTASGATISTGTLAHRDGVPFLTVDDVSLRLDHHGPGLYSLCDGEVLDLNRTPPTLANIRLHRRA